MPKPHSIFGLALWLSLVASVPAQVRITVDTANQGPRIHPAMWGIFFEDINFGADGGLYAEMVKNRSFEFPKPFLGWSEELPKNALGKANIRVEDPFHPDNPHYLELQSTVGGVSVVNEGFHGMGVQRGEKYDFALQARRAGPTARELLVELITPSGDVLARDEIRGLSPRWSRHKATLTPSETHPKARLRLTLVGDGCVQVDMVSLFPRNTWKKRPGGLRADMVQMLADLKPGFLRFPGGCIVEGRYLTNRYQWKTTIGPVEQRKLIINRWNDEFRHRPAPDYFQSFGLGFFEFFQLCEDIGAEPMPILNCGMACQFNSGQLVPMDQLDPYIQDALDLIEYANGAPTTPWGAKRAAMGHPAPFKMKMLGVGNEQWGPQYIERYAAFAKALKAAHPEITLISSAGPQPADDRFKFAWEQLRPLKAEIIDEHVYAAPKWFIDNATRYDRYDRSGPKVFMGEYAAQSVAIARPENRNTLECAIAEAAFMTGLERNADVVRLASYAPLFGHADGWQWTPNLIWCDDLSVFGTPNYYVQKLFSRNRGDVVLPIEAAPRDVNSPGAKVFASAVRDNAAGEIIIKAVNPGPAPIPVALEFSGAARVGQKGEVTVLTGAPLDENSLADPWHVLPARGPLDAGQKFDYELKPHSLTVLRVPVQ